MTQWVKFHMADFIHLDRFHLQQKGVQFKMMAVIRIFSVVGRP